MPVDPHRADAVLLDIDGVLVTSWRPLPGAIEAVEAIRASGRSLRFITNTTSRSRASIASTLRALGFQLDDDELLTATVATRSHLDRRHPGARCLVLNSGDAAEDLTGLDLAEHPTEADVVVLGGAGPEFTYEALNAALQALTDGAELVAMHRNLRWRTDGGDQLDAGAFLLGLEAAAGVEATVVGKPSADFFAEALQAVGCDAAGTVMVGDDLHSDVLGAQSVGITGVQVRTGKFRQAELDAAAAAGEAAPDVVLDSIADVPELLRKR